MTTTADTPQNQLSYHQGRAEKNPGSTDEFAVTESARLREAYDHRQAVAEGLAGLPVVRDEAQIIQATNTPPALHHQRPH